MQNVQQKPEVHNEPEQETVVNGGGTVFVLKSSDISADLVVDFWTLVQLRVAHELKRNYAPAQAVENIRKYFGVPVYQPVFDNPKLDGACCVAIAMRGCAHRKVAD